MPYEPASGTDRLIRMLKSSPTMFHIKWPIGDSSSFPYVSTPFEINTNSGLKLTFQLKCAIDLWTKSRVSIRLDDLSMANMEDKSAQCLYAHRPYVLARVGLTGGSNKGDGRTTAIWPFPTFAKSVKRMHLIWKYDKANDDLSAPSPILRSIECDEDFVVDCWLDVWEWGVCEDWGGCHLKLIRLIMKNCRDVANPFSDNGRNGQALHSTDIGRLFDGIHDIDRSEFSDVVLITKDHDGIEHRSYCHRNILCSRSPVFKSMFANPQYEESKSGQVSIVDVDHSTMMNVLNYIYTGRCEFEFENTQAAIALMLAADKHALSELVDECASAAIIANKLSRHDRDRLSLLSWAELLHLHWVQRFCLMALSTNMAMFEEEESRDKVSEDSWRELETIREQRAKETRILEIKSSGD